MDDWPSHCDELSRKTADVLDRWSKAYDAGRISKREYFILITGIYDTTSGLIDRKLMDLMARIHTELRKK